MNWSGLQKLTCHNGQMIDLWQNSILRNTVKMLNKLWHKTYIYIFLDRVERILKNSLQLLGVLREGLCESLCREEGRMCAHWYENDSITVFGFFFHGE